MLVPADDSQLLIMNQWLHKSSLLGDDPINNATQTAANAVPGLTIPIFAAMIKHVPTYRILEGLLFHRMKIRPVFFLAMRLQGMDRTLRLKPLQNMIHKSWAAMSDHLDELEGQLSSSGGPWICGHQFTLADVGMMVIFDRLNEGDWLDVFTPSRLAVLAYWEALQSRESYIKGCQNHNHPLVLRATEKIKNLKKEGQWPL